jgi:hypothetical protein
MSSASAKKKAENVVATSIGNAFYETAEDNEENIVYKFNPSDAGLQFIEKLNPPANATEETLQEFVYNKIYLVNSLDIVVANEIGIVCNKKKCLHKSNCAFIPNYPIINFGNINNLDSGVVPSPINKWIEIENCLPFFENLI